jgi:hypothetical protein
MNEKHIHHHQTGPEPSRSQQGEIPYWKRAHRDWRFWVGVVCIFAAIFVYVMTVDLSMVPRRLPPQPTTGVDGR